MQHFGYQLENQVFWRGIYGWEPDSTALWGRLCKKSSVIIDAGANTGLYSLIAKTVNPNSSVYAFEPVKRVFDKLEKNTLLNKFSIKCINKALSNKNGSNTIYDSDEEHTYSVTVGLDRSNEKDLHLVEIQTIKLDTFLLQNNIKNVDLVKIDVETHEPEMIEGFMENIKKYKPTIVIEIIRDYVATSVQEQLSGLGYLYFHICDEDDFSYNYKQYNSLINENVFGNYLICSKKTAVELGLMKLHKE